MNESDWGYSIEVFCGYSRLCFIIIEIPNCFRHLKLWKLNSVHLWDEEANHALRFPLTKKVFIFLLKLILIVKSLETNMKPIMSYTFWIERISDLIFIFSKTNPQNYHFRSFFIHLFSVGIEIIGVYPHIITNCLKI